MNTFKLIDLEGNEKIVEVKNKSLFEEKINKQAIFDAILSENSGSRQGTHSTLTKAEVRGGGRKPWRQKHTGKARQGSIRNPQWVGGGRAFGPSPNVNYTKLINKKVRKLAFRSAFTLKVKDQNVMLLTNNARMEKPSTKIIFSLIKKLKLENKKVLFVLNENNNEIVKSCNNINKVISKSWKQVSTKDLVNSSVTIVQVEAFNNLSGVFSNGIK
ncbi:MAG: 50S ribosomal protein L4 [Mycoplasmoidaceae bacterium]